jgi:hypothetical protein
MAEPIKNGYEGDVGTLIKKGIALHRRFKPIYFDMFKCFIIVMHDNNSLCIIIAGHTKHFFATCFS